MFNKHTHTYIYTYIISTSSNLVVRRALILKVCVDIPHKSYLGRGFKKFNNNFIKYGKPRKVKSKKKVGSNLKIVKVINKGMK